MTEETPGEGSTPAVTVENGRALVRLNRPKQHNRIEPADLAALRGIFDRIDADPTIRVLILTGTGKSFSSGFHIGKLAERKAGGPKQDNNNESFETVVDRLETLRIPTIAALNGGVYGGSTDLALACDFRIGVTGARMFMPATKLGIVYYTSGIRRYVNRLGLAAAKKLFLTAEPIEAAEMLRIGYLDEVVEPDQLMARVEALATTIGGNAPLAVTGMKRALNDMAAGKLDLDVLKAARAACAASEDHAEGLRAWAEKRKPSFAGR